MEGWALRCASTALTCGVGLRCSQSALIKLGFFTVAMVLGPIGTYFLSLKHIWGGRLPLDSLDALHVLGPTPTDLGNSLQTQIRHRQQSRPL